MKIINTVSRPSHTLEVHNSSAGQKQTGHWRWTLKDINGNIVGASTEGYVHRGFLLRNLRTVTGLYVSRDSLPRTGPFIAFLKLVGGAPRFTI